MGSLKREKLLAKNKRMKEVVKLDRRLLDACEELRYTVEHPDKEADIIMSGGVFRTKDTERIMTVKVDGVEIGYKVKPSSSLEINPYFDRYCYIRTPEHRLSDLTDKQLAVIKFTVLEAFFEPQQGGINTEVIGDGAILLKQRFMVVFAHKFQDATIQVPGNYNG
ncbi:MAG: hypothetical protein ABFD76_15300 [Smithella sp.]